MLQTTAGAARSPLTVPGSQPRAWHIWKSLPCLPEPKSSSHSTKTPLPSATRVMSGPSGSATATLQRQPWNFSQALGCPQKCRFLQECTEPGRLRRPGSPQPQLLPFPDAGASPARALAASPSCSHAPDFLPGGPPSSRWFFSRLLQHQAALCGRVKGKQAGEAEPGRASGPQLPRGACVHPPSQRLLYFFHPKEVWA